MLGHLFHLFVDNCSLLAEFLFLCRVFECMLNCQYRIKNDAISLVYCFVSFKEFTKKHLLFVNKWIFNMHMVETKSLS